MATGKSWTLPDMQRSRRGLVGKKKDHRNRGETREGDRKCTESKYTMHMYENITIKPAIHN